MAEYTPKPRIPEPVQTAFDALMASSWPSTDASFRARIDDTAERESQSKNPLRLNEFGLTSGMLSACVDPVAELRDRFFQLKGTFDTAIHPQLPKIQALQNIDRDIAEKQQESEQAQARITEKYESQSNYADAEKNFVKVKEEYEAMRRAEGQREAKDFPLWAYAVLMLGVGAAEWMVNYETFLNFTEIPLMAAGATILVALAVAVAAHYHGAMLKGHHHFFGDFVELAKRSRNVRVLVIVTTVLLFAFGGVGGARYLWVTSLASQMASVGSGALGGDVGVNINTGQVVTVSMVINLFVWFVGAAIAYAVHDENPNFTEKLRELKKAKKIFEPLRRKVDTEIFQLRSKLENEIKDLKNSAHAHEMEGKPLADLLAMVAEKTNKIESDADRLATRLIRTYRSALGDLAAVENPGLQFNKGGQLMDLEAFRQESVEFSFRNQLGEAA